jgi:site-specific recombinase XerD
VNAPEAITLFIEDGHVRGLSPRTLEHNRQLLDRFAEWSASHGVPDLRDLTLAHLPAYRRDLESRRGHGGRTISIAHVNRHIGSSANCCASSSSADSSSPTSPHKSPNSKTP